jgi:hypothetical protein
MTDRPQLSASQHRLALIWFIGGGLAFVLVIALSLTGAFGGQTPKAWSWFLPNIVPTLSLIIGTLVHDSARTPPEGTTVDGTLLRISLGLSVFYLVLLFGTLLARPPVTNLSPIEAMQMSSLWMIPLQGLVGGCLAAFFVSREN